jgi:hypothetical protein
MVVDQVNVTPPLSRPHHRLLSFCEYIGQSGPNRADIAAFYTFFAMMSLASGTGTAPAAVLRRPCGASISPVTGEVALCWSGVGAIATVILRLLP